jgi:hypothetical protein
MEMMRITLLLMIGVCLSIGDARAQAPTWSVFPLPVIFYTPETSVGGGAFAVATRQSPDGGKDDSLRGGALYTARNQVMAMADGETWVAEDNLRLKATLTCSLFPGTYFGIGPDADLEEDYTSQETRATIVAGWMIAPHLSVGPVGRAGWMRLVDTKTGGELAAGRDTTRIAGGGLLVQWDSRDRSVFPGSGQLATLEAIGYGRALGSSGDWLAATLDVRTYHSVAPGHIIALQAVASASAGEVALSEMPDIGGDSLMRGYRSGRYRDKSLVAAQAEYRFPLVWRLGGVLFGGAAQVAPTLAEIDLDSVKVAGGAGLRVRVIDRQHINVRADFGVSPADTGLYIQITEAY